MRLGSWLSEASGDVRHQWSNGGRALLIAGAVAGIAVLMAGTVAVTALVYGYFDEDHEPPNNLRFANPQKITSSRLVMPGGSIEVVGVKCNDDDISHTTLGRFQWRQIDQLGLKPIIIGAGTRTYPPLECETTVFINVLPDEITPGLWRVEGFEEDVDTGEIEVWFTESVRVIAPRQRDP